MCLSVVNEKIKNPTNKVIYAWKVFSIRNKRFIHFPYCSRDTFIPYHKWMTAEVRNIGEYRTGFHAFKTRAAARRYSAGAVETIRKVKLRKVRTIGIQNYGVCYVADEMLVIKAKHNL